MGAQGCAPAAPRSSPAGAPRPDSGPPGLRATDHESTAARPGLPCVGGSARHLPAVEPDPAARAALPHWADSAGNGPVPLVTGREGPVLALTLEPRRGGWGSPADRPHIPASLLALRCGGDGKRQAP